MRPEIAVAQRMRGFERAGMVAAQAGQRRRIVAGAILCRRLLRGGRGDEAWQGCAGRGSADAERGAVEKVVVV